MTNATQPAATPHKIKTDLATDESALRDAITALDYFDDPETTGDIERKIAALRSRLPDRGSHATRPNHTRWLRAEAWPDEDPGVTRFVVIHRDGTRRPKRGRVEGEGRGPTPRPVAGIPPPNPGAADDADEFPRGPRNGGR